MNIGIFAIFFIIFTTIDSFIPQCEENSNCQCSLISPEEIRIVCNISNGTEYIINKSKNISQIVCNDWKEWEDFNYKTIQTERIFNSLQFKHCGISDRMNLNDLAKQLGVKEISILDFQSFKNLGAGLTRWHLQGFSKLRKLVLSHNGLRNISKDLFSDYPKLEWIDLSNNNLVLPVDIFNATPNLKRLELAQSQIDRIEIGMFDKLQKLEFLNLTINHLAKFEVEIFDQLTSLKTLNLSRNMFSDLSGGIFFKLGKLETLDISFNNFSLIPSRLFLFNKELRKLFLHDNKISLFNLPNNLLANLTKLEVAILNNNGLTSLPENLFWGSSSLRHIVLKNNFLVTLPQYIFKGLWNVLELSLQKSKIINFPDRIFEDMRQLRILDLSQNYLIYISSEMFYGLRSLIELNMEGNQLKFVDIKAFLPIVNLRIAKFAHNKLKLTYVTKGLSVFSNNEYLTELDLSYNNISYFIDEGWTGNNNLKLLNLSHNNITKITINSLILPLHKIQIDLRYNQIKNIHFHNMFPLIRLHENEPGNVFLLGHNPLLCDCSLHDILNYREGKMNKMVYDYFNLILGNITCSKPDGTEMIEISKLHSNTYTCLEHEYFKTEEKCQIGCTCSIRPEDETRILDCSYKNMSEFLIDKTRVNFVEKKYPLILNLTGNSLTEVPSTEPLKPIKIVGLLLSNNHISRITFDQFPRSLKTLELHNNNISEIDSTTLKLFVRTMRLKILSLTGNPLICGCNDHLVDSVQTLSRTSSDLLDLKCTDTGVLMIQITEKLCPYKKKDITNTMLMIIAFFTIVTVIFITVRSYQQSQVHINVRYTPRQAY